MKALALCAFVAAALCGLLVIRAEAESRFYPFAGALVRHETAVDESPKAILAGQLGTAYSLGPVALQLRTVIGPERGVVFGRFELEFGARVKL